MTAHRETTTTGRNQGHGNQPCPFHLYVLRNGIFGIWDSEKSVSGKPTFRDLEAQPWKLATQYQSHFSSIARQAKSNLDGRNNSDRLTIGPQLTRVY